MEAVIFLAGVATGIGVLLVFGGTLRIFSPWLRCFLSGAPISVFSLIGMYLRGSPVKLLTDAHIGLVHSGKPVAHRISELESRYLASPARFMTSQDLVNAVLDEASQRSQ